MNLSELETATNELCYELVNDPKRWTITTYTLKDRKTGVEYWVGGYAASITHIWDSGANHRVFTDEQGRKIHKAYTALCSMKANKAQEKVIESLKKSSKNKPWYKFW